MRDESEDSTQYIFDNIGLGAYSYSNKESSYLMPSNDPGLAAERVRPGFIWKTESRMLNIYDPCRRIPRVLFWP